MSGMDQNRLRRMSRWMQSYVDDGRLAGLSVQISHRGGIAYSEHCGMRDREAAIPVTEDTIWRIYSMSKPITCLAALMLYEEGALRLDQPVADFVPGFGQAGVWAGGAAPLRQTEPLSRPVTLHDLFTHQAGLGYGDSTGNPLERAYGAVTPSALPAGATMAESVALMARLPLWFQPGQYWHYGLSHEVLGRVVEVISGQSLGDFLQDRIFGPLGMVDTGFDFRPDQRPRMATCYGPGAPAVLIAPADDPGYRAPVTMQRGGGGLLSTLPDYQRFQSMLLALGLHEGQRLIGRKTIELMTMNHLAGDRLSHSMPGVQDTPGLGYGLGFGVNRDPARAQVSGSKGEFGWGGYASTLGFIDPTEDLTVLLMTQLIPNDHYPLRQELRALVYQALD